MNFTFQSFDQNVFFFRLHTYEKVGRDKRKHDVFSNWTKVIDFSAM